MSARRVPLRRFLALLAAAASLLLVPPLRAQDAQDTAAAPDISVGGGGGGTTGGGGGTIGGGGTSSPSSVLDTTAPDTLARDRAASPVSGRARMPLWVPILFLGFAGAAAGAAWLVRTDRHGAARALLYAAGVVALFAAGLAGGLWWAGGPVRADPGAAAGWGLREFLLLGLAAVTLAFLAMFVAESRRHPMALESHWGGFGGGLGGLRVPVAGLYLLVALGFGTMLTVLAVNDAGGSSGTESEDKDAEKSRSGQADTTAGAAASPPAAAGTDSAAAAADTSQT